jgi:hypothetical protein
MRLSSIRAVWLLPGLWLAACGGEGPTFAQVTFGARDITNLAESAPEGLLTTDPNGPYVVTAVALRDRPLREVSLITCEAPLDCVFQAQRGCDEPSEGTCQLLSELSEGVFRGEILGRPAGSEFFFVLRAVDSARQVDFFPEIRNEQEQPLSLRVVVEEEPPPPPPLNCTDNTECPIGFVCNGEECVEANLTPTVGCTDSSECAPGFQCSFSSCQPEGCLIDEHCAQGSLCVGGECVPPGNLTACDSDLECFGPRTCIGGLCLVPECQNDTDCETPPATFCVGGACLPIPAEECESAADCEPGQDCIISGCFVGGIFPTCDDGVGCEPGQVCIAELCVTAVCEIDADCGEGLACVFGGCSPEQLPPPASCGPNDECPAGEFCVFGACFPENTPVPVPCGPNGECANGECVFGLCL